MKGFGFEKRWKKKRKQKRGRAITRGEKISNKLKQYFRGVSKKKTIKAKNKWWSLPTGANLKEHQKGRGKKINVGTPKGKMGKPGKIKNFLGERKSQSNKRKGRKKRKKKNEGQKVTWGGGTGGEGGQKHCIYGHKEGDKKKKKKNKRLQERKAPEKVRKKKFMQKEENINPKNLQFGQRGRMLHWKRGQ